MCGMVLPVPRGANPGDLYTEPPGLLDKDHLLLLSGRSLSIAYLLYTSNPSIFITPGEIVDQSSKHNTELRFCQTCNCTPVAYEVFQLFHSSP